MDPNFSRAILGKTNVNWDKVGGNPEDHPIESLYAHPDFDDSTTNNDVGLVKTLDEIRFSNMIQPICLPMNTMCLKDQTMVTITGWGSTKKDGSDTPLGMRGVEIPVRTSQFCSEKYGNSLIVADTMTCAGDGYNADGCDGDSGSPLTYRNMNDGVYTLWGMNSWSNMPCATDGYPGVYVRVSNFLQWVKDTSGVYPAGSLDSVGAQCDETFDFGLFGSEGLTMPVVEGTTVESVTENVETTIKMTTEPEVATDSNTYAPTNAQTNPPTNAPQPTEAPEPTTLAISQPNPTTNHTNSLESSPLLDPTDVLRDLMEQIFQSYGITSLGFSNESTRKRRQINSFDDILNAIQNYGCWCSKPLLGYASGGSPLDQTDSVCRQWAQCTHCEKLSNCAGSLTDSFTLDWTPATNAYVKKHKKNEKNDIFEKIFKFFVIFFLDLHLDQRMRSNPM